MRRYVWIVRVCFLLVAGALGIGAVQARQGAEKELRGISGITGQRQAIEFELDAEDRPRAFATAVYLHCSNGAEFANTWTPDDGLPAEFKWRGERLRVRERAAEDYGPNGTGAGVLTMRARITDRGVEGRMRSVWRFERDGDEQRVCDSGHIPFAAGVGAVRRVERMRPSSRPWSVYPPDLAAVPPRSAAHRRFVARLDGICSRALDARPQDGTFEQYLRWHRTLVMALRRVGSPPARAAQHEEWLRHIWWRLALERNQLVDLQDGDLDHAASTQVAKARVQAQGNAAGLRFGLRVCTGHGPTGAPRS